MDWQTVSYKKSKAPAKDPDWCTKCRRQGHVARACLKKALCFVCKAEGHMARDCEWRWCKVCHGAGHSAHECDAVAFVRRGPAKPMEIGLCVDKLGLDQPNTDTASDSGCTVASDAATVRWADL